MKEFPSEICLGLELIDGIDECMGPTTEATQIMGQAACRGCTMLCVSELRSKKDVNNTLMQEVEELQTDALTGLLTRRALIEEFEDYRVSGSPFAVIFLDIENFKSYNERYGHRGGDTILSAVGLALKNNVRSGDFPSRLENRKLEGYASRRGGDEIVILAALTAREINIDNVDRRFDSKSVSDHANDFLERIQTEFNLWLADALDEVQDDVVPANRIRTRINFHLGMVVSETGDTRDLEDLIHLADPEKLNYSDKIIEL